MNEEKSAYLSLCEELRKHNYLYYVLDEPIINDMDYDRTLHAVKDMEAKNPSWVHPESPTQTVGHPVYPGHFTIAQHGLPMLSLDNVFTPDEAIDWTVDAHSDGEDFHKKDFVEIVVEWKMDGLSLDLEYRFGLLHSAITRGDGTQGEDVTPNALMLEGIPRKVETDHPIMYVRGEVLPRLEDYHEINRSLTESGKKTYANPRNFAAGSLRLKDPKVTKERKLCFVAHGPEYPTEFDGDWYQDQAWLKANGFMSADTGKCFSHKTGGVTTGIPQLLKECETERPNYLFEVDGLVLKVVKHSHRRKLGMTSRYPRWARAYKFPASKGITTLLSVDRQVGRTGKLTPMARLEPVHVHGTTITNVTIHNLNELEQHQLFEGCEVLISRAGDVIPYLEKRITSHKDEPIYGSVDKCPSCDTNVTVVMGKTGSKTEYCSNPDCKGRRLAHLMYCAGRNVLNIKGLGDEIIQDLYMGGVIDITRPLSLLELQREDFLKIGQSDLMAEKLFVAVVIAKTHLDLTRVITALGISGAADGTSERLARELRDLKTISTTSVERLVEIKDIGNITAQSIFEFFDEDNSKADTESVWKPYVGDLYLKPPEALGTLFNTGTTFVVTGSKFGNLTRKELEAFFKKNGAVVSSKVTKSTTQIFCGTKYTQHKLDTAKELGIPWIVYNDDGVTAETNVTNPIKLTP